MAYAIEDPRRPGTWYARFRGYLRTGRDKAQAVIPRERLRPGAEKADGDAYATECEQACRLLEHARTMANISRARALKAITEDQAAALIAGMPAPSSGPRVAPLTVLEAARMHPSSARELAQDHTAALRHERELQAFLTWSGISYLADVELPRVSDYVAHLTKQGMSWDGRRHALLWLRRACRMGATQGLPDVLGELTLDRRPAALRSVTLAFWSLPELARAAVRTDDLRLRVTIGLGGFLGLRPSEILEVDIPDIGDGIIATGKKNKSSERLLPLPAFLVAWLTELRGQRKTGRLITTASNRVGGRGDFNQSSFSNWFAPLMKAASGKELPPKFLRKSFSSWAFRTRDLPTQHVEAIMGHKTALASIVTGRHYLADLVARELRPTAEAIDGIVSAALATAQREASATPSGVAPGGSTTQVAS